MTNNTSAPVMRPFTRTLRVALAAAALSTAPLAAVAQDDSGQGQDAQQQQTEAQAQRPDPGTVIATVDGEEITEGDLAFAAEDLSQELQRMPAGNRRSFLASVLIDMKVLAKAAREAGMQETEAFKRRQNYLEDRSLRRAYFSEKIGEAVTQEKLQSAYDEMVADFEPEEEVHARHILVESEEKASEIRTEIEDGKAFADAASEYSTDGSAQRGGDLGFFSKGDMVPAFEETAFALDQGEVSEPVESQFGWHLIKLEERRQSSPPPFQQAAQQLRQQLLFDAFDAEMKRLKADTEIDIKDPAMAQAINGQDGGATTPSEPAAPASE